MYIAALPKACIARNKMSRSPEEAIIIFLPIEDLINDSNHINFPLD
jgi:hypothetical protein